MKQNLYKKILAFLLVFGLLLPTAMDIVVNAVPNNTTPKADSENAETFNADTSTSIEEGSIVELTRDSQILKYIDQTVLIANKHVARLVEEETLSSYAFLNSDGTKTVYYMDKEVKFLDKDGKTVEKNIGLTNTRNGFTTVSNDIGLLLPNDPAKGISISYDGYDIIIVPEGGSLRKTVQSNDTSVVYPDYFGSGMSLMYTPSLDGVKEDIVLSRYTGVTTFAFRLFTDGLRPYQENNRYYLASSKAAEMRIDMGDVVAFDAHGRFSVGTMDVTTVAEGQEYLLTLSVDAEFLTDETTTYPVSIDPTLTVSDNTHGAGAIEDITIYSGTPNANCDWPYLHCGYYNSTYKIARTMFRLTGLLSSSEYQTANAAAITSAEFHIQEATGTAALPVHIYSNTGNATWTETGATWNNAGHILGSIYATTSPGVNQAVSYNITNLVKAWKNNTESAQAGFILVSSNETSLDKAFYSSETAYTAYRSYVVVNYDVGNSFSNAVGINLGQTVSINIPTSGNKKFFEFTPSTTGFYTIQSSNHTGNPKVWLYNCNEAELASDDDSGVAQAYGFALTYHLIANVKYYIAAGHYGSETGTYDFIISAGVSPDTLSTSTTTIGTGKSISINASYAFKYYKIEVPTTGFFVFQSSQENGDAIIRIYNSALSQIATDDNSGGNSKFRLKVYLTNEAPYYIAVGHVGAATGTYGFTALMPITVPTGINHLQNIGTRLYLDIHGPVEQELAHQWSAHTDFQERWEIKQQSNGYYTIQSQYDKKYYLGISNTNIGENNIVLLSSVTDYALWSIYGTPNGDLLIEPKSAPGKVICVPNILQGTELQLCWMSSAVASRNKWRIGVQWDVALEGQQRSGWCWAASARMLAKYYDTVSDEYTQEAAVEAVKGTSENNEGGDIEDAMYATKFYATGSIYAAEQIYTYQDRRILSETTLRRYLDDGHIVLTGRAELNENNEEIRGHATVIGGYTSCVVDNTLTYLYIIFDPWPADEPDPWPATPIPTTGQTYTASYRWIRLSQSGAASDPNSDARLWLSFIAVSTTYADTIPAPQN